MMKQLDAPPYPLCYCKEIDYDVQYSVYLCDNFVLLEAKLFTIAWDKEQRNDKSPLC